MKIKKISPSLLLRESINRELEQEQLNRKMHKEDDIIWQQMRWGHFDALMDSQKLFCKMYGEYSDYDETKLSAYRHSEGLGSIISDLEEVERHLYISCWYNSRDLSDVVFHQYAGEGTGIAIGTTVKALCEALEEQEDVERCFAGNVQYIPQRYFEKDMFEPEQFIAPVFLKSMQFKMDHEFRLCIYGRDAGKFSFNSEKEKEERKQKKESKIEELSRHMKAPDFQVKSIEEREKDLKKLTAGADCGHMFVGVKLTQLIKNVAVRSDSLFAGLGEHEIPRFFEEKYGLKLQKSRSSGGFLIFEVLEGGKVCDTVS